MPSPDKLIVLKLIKIEFKFVKSLYFPCLTRTKLTSRDSAKRSYAL